jgi:hypothetical protein
MPDPDKFVHEQRNELALWLAAAVADGSERDAPPKESVRKSYLSCLTTGSSQADEHQTCQDIDVNVPMKKVLCILPPGIEGSNAYFNEGEFERSDKQ